MGEESVVYGSQDVQRGSRKMIILLTVGIAIFLIIVLGVVRAQIKDARIQEVSITYREKMLESIVSGADFVSRSYNDGNGPYLNATFSEITLPHARAAINESKGLGEMYFESSKNNKVITFKRYPQEDTEVNRSMAVVSLSLQTVILVLNEGVLDLLEENKYDLDKKMSDIEKSFISDASKGEQVSEETRKELKDIGASLAPTSALLLNTIVFAIHHAEIWAWWGPWLGSNQHLFDDYPMESFAALEEAAEQMVVPTESEIAGLDLESDCIRSVREEYEEELQESKKALDGVLLISGSIEDICANLEKYEKMRALKVLERTKTEENVLVRLWNKQQLQIMVRCSDVWLSPEMYGCRRAYFDDFKLGIPGEKSQKEYEVELGIRSAKEGTSA